MARAEKVAMSARMIVELPDGQQVLFGGTGTGTGLAEVGVEEEIARLGPKPHLNPAWALLANW